jgi:predicted secreted Zn-dependent protease
MKFFWDKAKGLNADIERHREKEKELVAKIAELEGQDDEMSIASLRVYRNFLCQLQQSKADVVTKIGKK